MDRNERIEFPKPHTVEVVDQPMPSPDSADVLIETEQSLISTGTEITILTRSFSDDSVWDSMIDYPLSPGYCNVGRVIETGDELDDSLVGRRVASRTTHVRYATVHRDDCVVVPEAVSTRQAVFFELGKLALYSLRRGQVELGHAVGVFGLGIVGHLVVQLVDAAGSRPIFAFQTGAERRTYLPSKSHVVPMDPREDDWVDTVERRTDGRRCDVVFETTGNPDAIESQLRSLRSQGRLVVVSSPTEPTELDFHAISRHGYDVVGAHVYHQARETGGRNEWTATRQTGLFFDLVADGVLDVDRLVSHTFDSGKAPDAYETLVAEKDRTMGVLLEW